MDMRIADRLRAALAAALLLILMTGCGSEPKASPDTQETCLQIGMLFDNFVMNGGKETAMCSCLPHGSWAQK